MPRITYNESLTTTKESQYIFVGSKKAKETEKIVESILEGMKMFCLWIMTSCMRHLCDGQKIDKQKCFSLETCMYNLKQLILLESVSSNGAAGVAIHQAHQSITQDQIQCWAGLPPATCLNA